MFSAADGDPGSAQPAGGFPRPARLPVRRGCLQVHTQPSPRATGNK